MAESDTITVWVVDDTEHQVLDEFVSIREAVEQQIEEIVALRLRAQVEDGRHPNQRKPTSPGRRRHPEMSRLEHSLVSGRGVDDAPEEIIERYQAAGLSWTGLADRAAQSLQTSRGGQVSSALDPSVPDPGSCAARRCVHLPAIALGVGRLSRWMCPSPNGRPDKCATTHPVGYRRAPRPVGIDHKDCGTDREYLGLESPDSPPILRLIRGPAGRVLCPLANGAARVCVRWNTPVTEDPPPHTP